MNETTTYKIERIDPFGQGVALGELNDPESEKVTFIPKTLPGEIVEATLNQIKGKKVQFADIKQIIESSPLREAPKCPHFNDCQGCSFLQTSYSNEQKFKREAYAYLFKNLVEPESIELIAAPERFGYRNRIQLHYDLKNQLLGFRNRQGIHAISNCLIASPKIQEKVKELYENQSWLELLSRRDPNEGHIELSLWQDKVQVTINQEYSAGGFRQVYEEMGSKARDLIEEFLVNENQENEVATLELFGGHGFLSENLKGPRVICDSGPEPTKEMPPSANYVGTNLYGKWAPAKISKVIKKKEKEFPQIKEWNLIIDPPRSGFKTIEQFTQLEDLAQKTGKMAYLSCHPQGQKRDLEILLKNPQWKLEKLIFLDFFPATHHLESLALLKRL